MLVIGFTMAIVDLAEDIQCNHGAEMFYCISGTETPMIPLNITNGNISLPI